MEPLDLTRFAERINEWWDEVNATAHPGIGLLLVSADISYSTTGDDVANARFIIWGLERIREVAERPISLHDCSGPQWRVETALSGQLLGKGDTKAEAVARALYEVLG